MTTVRGRLARAAELVPGDIIATADPSTTITVRYVNTAAGLIVVDETVLTDTGVTVTPAIIEAAATDPFILARS